MSTSEGRVILPKSVREKIERGEQLRAQLTGAPPQSTDVLAGPPEGAPMPPPRVAMEVEGQQPPVEQPLEPPPPPPPPPPVEDEPLPQAADQDVGKLAQRLRTLEGKYTSETNELRRSLAQREDRIAALAGQVGELTLQLLNANQRKDLTPEVDPDTLSDDEVRDVGPDLLAVIERRARAMARQIVSAETADLRSRLEKLGGSVETLDTRAQVTERERFHTFMDHNCPGWLEQDSDPEFLAWLEQPDPFLGGPRKFGVQAAIKSGQYDRVASIFKGYVKERQAVTPSATDTAKPNGRIKLDTLAAPAGGRGRTEAISSVDHNAPEPPVTQKQIREFYALLAKPRHGLTEDEITRMEARIARDVAQGRVVVQSRV